MVAVLVFVLLCAAKSITVRGLCDCGKLLLLKVRLLIFIAFSITFNSILL